MLRSAESPAPMTPDARVGFPDPMARPRWAKHSVASVFRTVGSRTVLARSWDRLLYCCGGAALLSLTVWCLFPRSEELALFAWLMFLTSGPTSTFLPSASEPILMAFGKLYSPLLLALIGVAAIALVEWLNYRVFGAVLLARRMDKVRTARITRWLMACFGVLPFTTVMIAAFTPIPFWLARCCAVLSHYPMPRFILATAIGRFPRVWLIATVGTLLPVTSATILTVGGVVVLVAGAVAVARRRKSTTAVAPTTAEAPAAFAVPLPSRR
jgi:membrane protein YqaA with SNARE-associated domain